MLNDAFFRFPADPVGIMGNPECREAVMPLIRGQVKYLTSVRAPACSSARRPTLQDILNKLPRGRCIQHGRIKNCLHNEGLDTIEKLCCRTEAEMLRNPNFGRGSLNALKTALAECGLHLGMEPADFADDSFLKAANEEYKIAVQRLVPLLRAQLAAISKLIEILDQ